MEYVIKLKMSTRAQVPENWTVTLRNLSEVQTIEPAQTPLVRVIATESGISNIENSSIGGYVDISLA